MCVSKFTEFDEILYIDGGLETWHHPAGRFVMIGDAVHPMLPYLAQGANSALEDAAVLGECLKKVRITVGAVVPATRLTRDEHRRRVRTKS